MRLSFKLWTALVCAVAFSSQSNASVVTYVYESGGNVISVASGTLDTSSLTYISTNVSGSAFNSGTGGFGIGSPASQPSDVYSGLTSFPTYLGSSVVSFADSGSGNKFGMTNISGISLFVEAGFVSGGSIFSTATYLGQTLSSMGLTTGSYLYNWASDSVTLKIGVSPVPLPATLPMLAAGMLGLGLWRRRKSSLVG